jgi:hypothetical protein
MAYIFTLLMFRKPNKTTINKNKATIFYRSTSLRCELLKCILAIEKQLTNRPQVITNQSEHLGQLKDLEISKYKRESKARVLYILINSFFKQIVDIFFNNAYYQESYILIIEYSSVVTVYVAE